MTNKERILLNNEKIQNCINIAKNLADANKNKDQKSYEEELKNQTYENLENNS
jgi:hypothetical protein